MTAPPANPMRLADATSEPHCFREDKRYKHYINTCDPGCRMYSDQYEIDQTEWECMNTQQQRYLWFDNCIDTAEAEAEWKCGDVGIYFEETPYEDNYSNNELLAVNQFGKTREQWSRMTRHEWAALGFNPCKERSWFATSESDAFTLYCRAQASGSIFQATGNDLKLMQTKAYLELQSRQPGRPSFKRECGQYGAKFFKATLHQLEAVYDAEQAASSHPATQHTA